MTDRADIYGAAGVDYQALDAAKRDALAQALATSPMLHGHGGRALDESRGEPAFVFEFQGQTLAFVLECLGTKSIVAREYQEAAGVDRFSEVAYDSVAAIVNDLCCVGALPLVVNAYFSTGSSDWYSSGNRLESLVSGWRKACEDAGASWGGGESPTLPGLVADADIELAGSAVGYVPPGTEPVLGTELAGDDEIVLVASTGLHANGASLARRAAAAIPAGWNERLPSGATLGDAVLTPAPLYVELIASLLRDGVPVTYLSHITGHGLRKLMRARKDLTYRVDALPEVPEVLRFLIEHLEMERRESYGTFNMGTGFAVFCRPGAGDDVVSHATSLGLGALVGGRVEEGPRRVLLEPVGVKFTTDDLQLR